MGLGTVIAERTGVRKTLIVFVCAIVFSIIWLELEVLSNFIKKDPLETDTTQSSLAVAAANAAPAAATSAAAMSATATPAAATSVTAAPAAATSASTASTLSLLAVKPSQNKLNVASDSVITATFNEPIIRDTVGNGSFNVDGSISGNIHSGNYSVSGVDNTITFDPETNFAIGETITVTLQKHGLQSSAGALLETSYTWQFVVEVKGGSGIFTDSGQSLGQLNNFVNEVALADLDSDGDLDALVANGVPGQGNKVWINNGAGIFSDSGQILGNSLSQAVELGDLDGDGDSDAFVANLRNPNSVWLNDGAGNFSNSGQLIGSSEDGGTDVALGDLDGDGDLDALVANSFDSNSTSKVWLNDGLGNFSDSGQSSIPKGSTIFLGDLDNDGDLDAFMNSYILVNNGSATFSWDAPLSYPDGHGQTPSDIALGDLDGDGDLDIYVATNGWDTIWLNKGDSTFTAYELDLVGSNAQAVALGDSDGDGDLDVFLGIYTSGNYLLINDGAGIFDQGSEYFGTSESTWAVALGDLDGDGDLDVFVANHNPDSDINYDQIWLNQ